MEMIDMYAANELMNEKYEPIWKTLSEEVKFICETLAYFSWDKEVSYDLFLRMAKECQPEYSDSIKKLTKKELIDLLKKVINQ